MKKIFLYSSIFLLMAAGFYACDTTTAPEDKFEATPTITQFSVFPKDISFNSEEHSPTDTIITVTVEARFENLNDTNVLAVLSAKGSSENIAEEIMELTDEPTETYRVTFEIETYTTSFHEYIVNVIFSDGSEVYAQSNITITGFSNNPPQIIEIDSPDSITRPSSGSVPATFTAKVTDLDGQDNIDKVYIAVINQSTGEVEGSPFTMNDAGVGGDETANDSTYTWSLPVTPTNINPNRDFDIEFFAIDFGGMSSDTVRTTFSIVE